MVAHPRMAMRRLNEATGAVWFGRGKAVKPFGGVQRRVITPCMLLLSFGVRFQNDAPDRFDYKIGDIDVNVMWSLCRHHERSCRESQQPFAKVLNTISDRGIKHALRVVREFDAWRWWQVLRC